MTFYIDAFNKIRVLKKDLKDTSINAYLRTIKKITQRVYNKSEPDPEDFDNFEFIKKGLEKIENIATRKNTVTAILVLMKSLSRNSNIVSQYGEYLKELSRKQEDNYMDNLKSEKEEKNWVSRQDILDKIESLKSLVNSGSLKDKKLLDVHQQILVLSLYYILPPLRNDYANTIVINSKNFEDDESCINTNVNYINLATKKLLLCTYKTQKFYGIKKIDIPEELMELIIKWENLKKKYVKTDYLLLSIRSGSKMSSNLLTVYLNKIFKPKKVSTTLFRKIYLSEKYPVKNTYRDQAYDAMVMGHSLNTQKMIYSKITD